MASEELKQEAEEWLNKWELCNKCDHKVQCIEDNAMCPQVVEQAYLASAEPREKRIAELEHQLTHRNCLDCSNHSSKLRMRTLELEKENAELKHTIATLRQEKDNVSMHAKAMEVVTKTRSDQLTKSKELLKKWLQTSNASGCNNINIITDTEQFLNSEVEKKWKR